MTGYQVSVAKIVAGVSTPVSGCGTAVVVSGDRLRVTVRVQFSLVTPLAGAFVGNNIMITRTSEVVVE